MADKFITKIANATLASGDNPTNSRGDGWQWLQALAGLPFFGVVSNFGNYLFPGWPTRPHTGTAHVQPYAAILTFFHFKPDIAFNAVILESLNVDRLGGFSTTRAVHEASRGRASKVVFMRQSLLPKGRAVNGYHLVNQCEGIGQ